MPGNWRDVDAWPWAVRLLAYHRYPTPHLAHRRATPANPQDTAAAPLLPAGTVTPPRWRNGSTGT